MKRFKYRINVWGQHGWRVGIVHALGVWDAHKAVAERYGHYNFSLLLQDTSDSLKLL